MILGEGVNADLVKSFIAGTVVSKYGLVEEQVVAVRDKLAALQPEKAGDAIVQIDHSFSVRGVGTVALGVVKQGKIKKHDEVVIYPDHKKTQVKSVQVHDVDVEDAGPGVRVGLSLKNVEPDDVPRGAIISTSSAIKIEKRLDAEAHLSKYSKRSIVVGDVVNVVAYLNYTPAKVVAGGVAAGGEGRVQLDLEKYVPMLPGRLLLLDPGQKPPRVFGYIDL
jgi:selenocysteine-specific translation elongation factor